MGARPFAVNAFAVSAGVASALILLGAAVDIPPPGFPATLLAAGDTATVPPFHNGGPSGSPACGWSRCGSPGELRLEFSVSLEARLSGSLQTGGPIEVWVANGAGMEAACGLSNPPPPCAPQEGQPYLYQTSTGVSIVDFGQLALDFVGDGHVLPSGVWTILLINWSDRPVLVTADSDLRVIPEW
ncbi:MAG: hypothetical protein L3J73_03765 [Thermoplasmata archaeon]|nr:hypothetical protein [Thermoplasmata archaeon]